METYQKETTYGLENHQIKLIKYLEDVIHFLNNKERSSEEEISLQHLRFLRQIPEIEEIEFDNLKGEDVQKRQYSLLSEEHLKSFLDSTRNYNKESNNNNWKTDKKKNPNYKKHWCKFGKRCRNKNCWFRHGEDVGLLVTPSSDKWCQSCLASKGECTCIHSFVSIDTLKKLA